MSNTKVSLKIIIVGAGFAGLTTAIELRKRGHEVHVFEVAKDLTRQGDIIMIGSSGTRAFSRWNNMLESVVEIASQPDELCIQDKHGNIWLIQALPKDFDGYPNVYVSRTRVQNLLYDYARGLGVKFTFSAHVGEYFESDQHAGIHHLGERFQADLVVAADSVHSLGREFVTGTTEKAMNSGFSVYRSWFSLDVIEQLVEAQNLLSTNRDYFGIWIAQNTHAIISTNLSERYCTCFVTHKDDSNIKESWNVPGKLSELLKAISGWDPALIKIAEKIPEDILIDYKLLWRDPIKSWTSPKGRVVLVGDAAHPHLPTAGTGGTQAIEDGVTLAVCLEQAKEDVALATKVFERLRYERTSLTQRMGWETRHRWHQTDWATVAKDASNLKMPQPAWLNGHDAEEYAKQNFQGAAMELNGGPLFQSTNVPAGHQHEDWTIGNMMETEGTAAGAGFYKVQN